MFPQNTMYAALLQGVVAASASSQAPIIPISYSYGGYPRVQADIRWGTPEQSSIPTIFDTGSPGFWTYGPKAIINDGSNAHYQLGPCNKTVKTFFNWPKSSTHTNARKGSYGYAYGGNGKIVSAYETVNDSFAFSNPHFPALTNNQVATANFTVVSQSDDKCRIPESDFDHSIMGLAPLPSNQFSGPSFRDNLRRTGKTKSKSFSMWFDKAPKSIKTSYSGAAVFGAVPSKAKYTGPLVRIKQKNPDGVYVGYYAALPQLTTTSIKHFGKPSTIGSVDPSVKQCLLDSGTGTDQLPFNETEIMKATGLIRLNYPYVLAWNGSCDSIPREAAFNFTFAGSTPGKKVTVAVPIRSYARGVYDDIPGYNASKYCAMSFEGSSYGSCVFGASFFTAAFAVFHDDKQEIALAQGGVSTSTDKGPEAIGSLKIIDAGSNIPGSV